MKHLPRTLRNPGALLALLLMPTAAWAGTGDDGQVNPHWSKSGCPVCHVDAAPGSPNAGLKNDKAEALCDACHGENVRQCPHASGIPAGEFAGSMPDTYKTKLDEGKVVCTTCHDLPAQCLNPSRSRRYKNPGFVRDGRFGDISEQCFLCHAKSAYRKPSPHMQVRGKGKLKEGTCLFCHRSLPVRYEEGSWGPVDFNMKDDLNDACRGCHNLPAHPGTSINEGPGGWVHLIIPPIAIGERMRQTEADTGTILPLDPGNGRIFCGTCHNPHDKKLPGYPAAESPGETKLRVENICGACHEE